MSAMTPRQWKITELVSEGMSNKEIAAHFSVRENTVKKYLVPIFDKTGMSNRTELAGWFYAHRGENEKNLVDNVLAGICC